MLARVALRDLVVQQLLDHFGGAVAVWQNRTLPMTADKLPAIIVATPHEKKASLGRNAPANYYTTVTAALTVRTTGVDDLAAMNELERVVDGVEAALLANQAMLDVVNHFPSVESMLKVVTTGDVPLAEATMHIECELPEEFDPTCPMPFLRIEATVPVGTQTIPAAIDLPQV